jgi:hypothetical protein
MEQLVNRKIAEEIFIIAAPGKKIKKISFFKWIFIWLFIFSIPGLYGQSVRFNKDNFTLNIPNIFSEIEIDGSLHEPQWDTAGTGYISWLHYPVDTGNALAETRIKMMYNESNLYIAFISKDTHGKPVVQSLKRDDESNTNNNDGVTIVLDPANTAKNGYFFRVNAAGAMVEGMVYQNGMYPSGNVYWDNKWYAKTLQSNDSVYYEIAVPFSAIKFKDEKNTWGINFQPINTISTWVSRVTLFLQTGSKKENQMKSS